LAKVSGNWTKHPLNMHEHREIFQITKLILLINIKLIYFHSTIIVIKICIIIINTKRS